MWSDERGVALPIVIALSTIMFLIVTIAISQSLRSRQAGNMHLEMIRVSYAAESGIAHIQAKLQAKSLLPISETIKINQMTVHTELQRSPLQVIAIAYGRFGVKQTITAQLSATDFRVIRWIK